MDDPKAVELILMECDAEFDDITVSFGGDDFTLTVRICNNYVVQAASVCLTLEARLMLRRACTMLPY